MVTTACDIYDRLDSEQAIANEAATKPEMLHLEFKERKETVQLRDDPETLNMLAKALSGFANADGGVLVLGVENKTRQLRPFKSFRDDLQEVHAQLSRLVSGPVAGTTAKAIEAVDGNGGYVLLLVPSSDEAPHMSRKDHKYYRRVGESFVTMEHYEVADMFGRRPQPLLRLHARIGTIPSGARKLAKVTIFVANRGRGLAKFPLVRVINQDFPDFKLQPAEGPGLPAFESDEKTFLFHGRESDVVHSGLELGLFGLLYKRETPYGEPDGNAVSVTATLAAEGMQTRNSRVVVRRQAINNVLAPVSSTKEFEGD